MSPLSPAEALLEARSAIAGRVSATRAPAIADYAAIGDCRTAALVSRNGSIDWLCLPHLSAPSVFGALLDQRRGGRFVVCPETDTFKVTRRYVGATNVLETIFETDSGRMRLTDLLPMPANAHRIEPMREVIRIAEDLDGTVKISALIDPRPDYGRQAAVLSSRGTLGWAWSWGDELLGTCTDMRMSPASDGTALAGRVTISAGERRYFSLCYTQGDIGCIAPLGAAAEARRDATLHCPSLRAGRSFLHEIHAACA